MKEHVIFTDFKGEREYRDKNVVVGLKMEKRDELPTTKEQAVHPPLLDLRTGFPLRSTVPSCV